MNIRRTRIGNTTGHAAEPPTPVDAYTLDTGAGLAITVWTYGATLIDVLVPDRKGDTANMIVRLNDLASYEDRARNPYVGATLGRFARCIANGRFQIDRHHYQLDRNCGSHHFHGGTIGFDRFVWDADAAREGESLVLRLRLERPHHDQGYPGAISAETLYRVDRDRRLTFEHRATTTTVSTVVALTNHAYWNLAGTGTVNGHLLAVNANRVVTVDEELIPLGLPATITGTHLDYSTPRPIGSQKLDHCFILDEASWAADLFDPASGRALCVHTDQPGLAIYSADAFSQPRAGLCIQTGALPDSPNRPDFPSPRLDPGDLYLHRTTHQFSIRS